MKAAYSYLIFFHLSKMVIGTCNYFSSSDSLTHQQWFQRWSGWLLRSGRDNMAPLPPHRWSRDVQPQMQCVLPHRGFRFRPSWMWMSQMEVGHSSEGVGIIWNKILNLQCFPDQASWNVLCMPSLLLRWEYQISWAHNAGLNCRSCSSCGHGLSRGWPYTWGCSQPSDPWHRLRGSTHSSGCTGGGWRWRARRRSLASFPAHSEAP